jgi:hypothetical protein
MANRNIISAEVTGPVYWSAVTGGIFVALIVHILLNMLGAGIGAASVDVRTPTQGEVQGIGWGAFAWWSVAGIVAAFVGGWAAGVLASAIGSKDGSLHGFLSWTVTTVLVIAGAALAAGTAAATIGALFTPLSASIARLQATPEVAQTTITAFSLASMVALVIGAVAATWGGRLGATRTSGTKAARK